MATAAFSPSAHYMVDRRESSPRRRSSEMRRPRLMRACATEPSITTSSACRGVLTSPDTTKRRATDLLSRVAVSNASSSPPSTRTPAPEAEVQHNYRYSDSGCNPHSACYFSFPSFDAWEEATETTGDEEKMLERGT
ncbi:hypothetical protein F4780DRAFT_780294 [Xylariomycetidae sp. FL0641]|nr:hypothetical protein F4780DRAFT_780294 [Xylariomycetidae sp. FL0641]